MGEMMRCLAGCGSPCVAHGEPLVVCRVDLVLMALRGRQSGFGIGMSSMTVSMSSCCSCCVGVTLLGPRGETVEGEENRRLVMIHLSYRDRRVGL